MIIDDETIEVYTKLFRKLKQIDEKEAVTALINLVYNAYIDGCGENINLKILGDNDKFN